MPPKKITGTNMNKAIFADEFLALCAFACPGRAKENKIDHTNGLGLGKVGQDKDQLGISQLLNLLLVAGFRITFSSFQYPSQSFINVLVITTQPIIVEAIAQHKFIF